jgi:hypothetical protein
MSVNPLRLGLVKCDAGGILERMHGNEVPLEIQVHGLRVEERHHGRRLSALAKTFSHVDCRALDEIFDQALLALPFTSTSTGT